MCASVRRTRHQAPHQRQARDDDVSAHPDLRHRHVEELRIRAVIDDSAVPLLVDGARLGLGRVVNAQREVGHEPSATAREMDRPAALLDAKSAEQFHRQTACLGGARRARCVRVGDG